MDAIVDSTWQVLFIDALFLCLAAGLALWFRSWLGEREAAFDRRLDALEEQQQALARVCERLTSACRGLERPAPSLEALRAPRPERPAAPAPGPTPVASPPPAAAEAVPAALPREREGGGERRRIETPASLADRQWEERTDRSREAYRRARALLEQGIPPNDIARQVGLGVAEVNVLKRMRDAGRR
jgi:hypothetical protein